MLILNFCATGHYTTDKLKVNHYLTSWHKNKSRRTATGTYKKGHPLPGDLYQIQLYSAPALMAVQRLSDVCLTHCTVTLRTALLLVLPLLSDTV